MSQSSGPVARVEVPQGEEETLGHLVDLVRESCPRPLNALQVTALLETAGVTDQIASRRYGYADVFELGEVVTAEIATSLDPAPPVSSEVEPDDRRSAIMDYLRGPMNLMPLVVVIAMVARYQTASGLSGRRIVLLSLASVVSLLVSSGFVQIVARKGSIYLSQGYLGAAKRFLGIVLAVGLGSAAAAAGAMVMVTTALGLSGPGEQLFAFGAVVVLSTFWVLAGMLNLVGRSHWFGASLVTGALLSWGLLPALRAMGLYDALAVPLSAVGGVLLALGGMQFFLWSYFDRQPQNRNAEHRKVLPPAAHLIVALAPYFAYGVAYVLMVGAGHVGFWVGAWGLRASGNQALALGEMALTLALTSYIVVGGIAEHTMQRFWKRINHLQAAVPVSTPGVFGDRVGTFLGQERRKYLLILAACSVLLTLAVLGGTAATGGRLLGFPWSGSTTAVFVAGLVGYGLLGLGMFDSMLFITLSQPTHALIPLLVGLVVTLVTGIGLGLLISYVAGALGILLGGVAYLVAVRRRLKSFLRQADYYFYASF